MKRRELARPVRRWVLVAVALSACATGPLAAVASSASAAVAHVARGVRITPGSRYLALGDSVTFGYQESQVVPAPNYHDAASFLGYPEQLAAELHLRLANAACPGETSTSLIDASAPSNGCENVASNSKVGYRSLFPLHVRYKGAQLAYALRYLHRHHKVRLVSLMIGANDYFLCLLTTKDRCSSSAERRAVLDTIGHNIRRILHAIRKKAHYRGQIAIVHYYSLNYSSASVNAMSIALNSTADAAAKPFHVVFADGYGELQAATLRFGGDPCKAGLVTQLGSPGKCGIHPSYAGQALLAQALEKAIRL